MWKIEWSEDGETWETLAFMGSIGPVPFTHELRRDAERAMHLYCDHPYKRVVRTIKAIKEHFV
jgi:hypothetical protein